MGSALSIVHADGCPVDHENMSPDQIAAFMSQHSRAALPPKHPNPAKAQPEPGQTALPLEEKSDTTPKTEMYDVYGQQLDASNMMPTTPNQLPSPGQQQPLSTDRVQSTIPKPADDSESKQTWVYPSPQMFFNALKRKGKASDVSESDMPTVVAVHNRMNELTWKQILRWEARFHCHECPAPKLKRFQGRPHDLSPVARFRSTFRDYPRPFDRHDWVVDRCGKADARYVIDYYYRDGPDPIELHVRPAVDSPQAAYDRFCSGILFVRQSLGLPVPPLPSLAVLQSTTDTPSAHPKVHRPPAQPAEPAEWEAARLANLPDIVKGDQLDAQEFSFLTQLTPDAITEIAQDVETQCKDVHHAFVTAAQASFDPAKLEQANVSLNYCMAKRICKVQATGFMNALENDADPSHAYADVTACLDRFQIMARRALLDAAGVKRSGPEFPVGDVHSVANLALPQAPAAASTTDATASSTTE